MENLKKEKLSDVQSIILLILTEIVRVCTENNIPYYLSGGTLIGAVRHNGFIPWDDDADINMLRKDYKRFIKVCKRSLRYPFFLDCIESSDNYEYNFAKVKMHGTVFEEKMMKNTKTEKCVWVDVFPLDKTTKLLRRPQERASAFFQNVRWKKIGANFSTNHKKINGFCAKTLNIKLVNFFADLSMQFFDFLPLHFYCGICYPSKIPMNTKKEITELMPHVFETIPNASIPVAYDKLLKDQYGDWRSLPPKEDRHPRHG